MRVLCSHHGGARLCFFMALKNESSEPDTGKAKDARGVASRGAFVWLRAARETAALEIGGSQIT